MHFSLEWFLLELSWNVASYRGSVYTKFDDEGSAAGNLETWNRALIITLPLFSIGSCRYIVPWNSNLLLFWCSLWIYVPGTRYAGLKMKSMSTRATQKPEVWQKGLGFLVDGTLDTSQLYESAKKKANGIPGWSRSSIARRLRELIILLCSALVRHIQGAASSCEHRSVLERVQYRAVEVSKG